MGLEAYRIGLKLMENPKKENVINAFLNLGATLTDEGEFTDVTMEILLNEGIIEILINNPAEHEKALNKFAYEQGQIKFIEPVKSFNKVIVFMRFAKPNSINLVDKLIDVIKKFSEFVPVELIKDFEANKEIDLSNYIDFKQRVKLAKEEFEHWNAKLEYPIRCKDVYKKIFEKDGIKQTGWTL